MKPYRDAVTRISMRQLRGHFTPREFEELTEFVVQAGTATTHVKIARAASKGAFSGTRRWLLCPACSRMTSVIGFVVSSLGEPARACCFRCASWRSRKVPRSVRSQQ